VRITWRPGTWAPIGDADTQKVGIHLGVGRGDEPNVQIIFQRLARARLRDFTVIIEDNASPFRYRPG